MIFNIYKKTKKEPDVEIQITYNPTYTTSSNQGSSYGFWFDCSNTDNRDDEIDDLDELLDEFDCNPDFDI